MAHHYFNPGAQAAMNPYSSFQSQNHHSGRSRRGARFSSSHSSAKPFKPSRTPRDNPQVAQAVTFRKDFEAARSFDLEDDEIFCPWHLLTEDDLQSIHSSSSDRSSSSAGSPDSSPLQQQIQPTPSFALSATAHPHMPSSSSMQHGSSSHLKIHQPLAQRTRNAIPIVDPNSRATSPPTSISPGRQLQKQPYMARRW